MIMTIGNKVFYPFQGLCIIGPVVKRVMNGKAMRFYHLSVLEDGGDLFVPVDKIATVGMRALLKRSEIPELLNHLKIKPLSQPRVAHHYSQRALVNAQLITSGSAFDLAEIVSSLTEFAAARSLSYGQKKTLDKAKRLLIGEISEVTGETKVEVEAKIDRVLKTRKKE
jgi:CarD family transcriptional regulator